MGWRCAAAWCSLTDIPSDAAVETIKGFSRELAAETRERESTDSSSSPQVTGGERRLVALCGCGRELPLSPCLEGFMQTQVSEWEVSASVSECLTAPTCASNEWTREERAVPWRRLCAEGVKVHEEEG